MKTIKDRLQTKYTIKSELFTKFFQSLGHRFIATGDYNAKHPWWGSRALTPSPRGRQLYEAMQKEKLFPISTGEPTYWPSDKDKTPDLIDLAVVKGINHEHFSATSCFDLSSDHSPIIILLNQELKMVQKATYLSNKKTDWVKFKEYINHNLTCNQSLKTAEEIDKAVEDFNMLLHSAAKEATPQFTPYNQTKTIPKYILEKIQEKRRLRKSWQITRSKPIKTTLNKITKDLKNMLIEEKNATPKVFRKSNSN